MSGVVIPHLHFITTHDGMNAGARATQEQLPVGRLSPCPAGAWVESYYGVMIHNQVSEPRRNHVSAIQGSSRSCDVRH